MMSRSPHPGHIDVEPSRKKQESIRSSKAANRFRAPRLYSTFPIVEREETAEYGTYRSRDLALAWANALAAGNPDAAMAP